MKLFQSRRDLCSYPGCREVRKKIGKGCGMIFLITPVPTGYEKHAKEHASLQTGMFADRIFRNAASICPAGTGTIREEVRPVRSKVVYSQC